MKKGKKVDINYVYTNIVVIFLVFLFFSYIFIELMNLVGVYKLGYKWFYVSTQKVIFKGFLFRYIFIEILLLSGFISFCVWFLTNKNAEINRLLTKFIKNNNYVIYEIVNNRKKIKNKIDIFYDYNKKDDYLIVRIQPNGSNFDRDIKNTAREKLEDLFSTSLSNMNMDFGLLSYEIAFNTNDRLEQLEYVDNGVKLDKKKIWYYNDVPHSLIAGTTGTGKTYFLNYVICCLLYNKADITFIDPKWSDVKAIGELVNPNKTACDENNICKLVREFKESMQKRQKLIADTGRTNITYKDIGLKPEFLIFDEFSAFKSIGIKGNSKNSENSNPVKEVEGHLKRIILMGRSTGNFVILVAQQPNADVVETGIRDQLGLKVAFGNTKEELKRMMFGTEIKLHTLDSRLKGVGYVSLSNAEPYKYYSPNLGPKFDYVEEIKRLL